MSEKNQKNNSNKVSKNILIAFLLNFGFSIYELIGGILTGSVAISSDAIHDFGDAMSIGLAYVLERKSRKEPDEEYSYGYARYSVLGGLITSVFLIIGSLLVIYRAVERFFVPVEIAYDGMIILAIIGVVVNAAAAYLTSGKKSLNQKAVNLHMLEDVLGWMVVLIGAVAMRFTGFSLIDPILSILVAGFILFNAIKNLKSIFGVLLDKTPVNLSLEKIREDLAKIPGVQDMHHLHIWSLDGAHHYITLHMIADPKKQAKIKKSVRETLTKYDIFHATIEFEGPEESCVARDCANPVDSGQNALLHHHGHQH